MTETGTSQSGFNLTKLHSCAKVCSQAVYRSIGYATGAAIRLSIAAKEMGTYRQVVICTREGNMQLTIQALFILNRHGDTHVV